MSAAPTIQPPAVLHAATAPEAVAHGEARAAGASVVVTSINRPQGITGVHTHTAALMTGLEKLDCSATHINPFCGSRFWLGLFAIRPLVLNRVSPTAATLWYRHFHAVALGSNLTTHLSRASADAIVAQCPVSARVALDVRKKLNLDVPVALVAHFNHSEAEEYRILGQLHSCAAYQRMLDFENYVLVEVDQVIYVSDFARRTVEEHRSVRPRRSTVIHNGIPDVTRPPALTREMLGLSSEHLVLVNVGTLEPRKNQLDLLGLFAEIHSRFPQARLLLVGEGPHRAALESAIRARNLTGAVRLLGSRNDVHELLALSDLYLHYAKLENCPVVLLECARAGRPFAAIPTGGIPELQSAMGVSIALDPTNIRNSFTTLHPLLNNRQLREDLGRRARAAFESRFTTDAMTRGYLTALNLTPAGASQ